LRQKVRRATCELSLLCEAHAFLAHLPMERQQGTNSAPGLTKAIFGETPGTGRNEEAVAAGNSLVRSSGGKKHVPAGRRRVTISSKSDEKERKL
jgi:hypothetical protein